MARGLVLFTLRSFDRPIRQIQQAAPPLALYLCNALVWEICVGESSAPMLAVSLLQARFSFFARVNDPFHIHFPCLHSENMCRKEMGTTLKYVFGRLYYGKCV